MSPDVRIPDWARDRRTFMLMNLAIGAALTVLLVGLAFLAPAALGSAVDALLSRFLLIALAVALLVVGVRRVILGPARKQEIRSDAIILTYILSARPVGLAVLTMAALVTLALIFHWQHRFELVQSLLLLLMGFAVFSMIVKTVLNAQMLMRHWFGR